MRLEQNVNLPISMQNEDFIPAGLNALARAHEAERVFFDDGHRGAAAITAYFFAREQELDAATRALFAEGLGASFVTNDLFAPLPGETAAPGDIDSIARTLEPRIGDFKLVGHNTIFAAAALKALRHMPEHATRERIEGICKLLERFDAVEPDDAEPAGDVPPLDDEAAFVAYAFNELIGCMDRFRGYGQGWAGHLTTYTHALVELHDMGFAALADAGRPALATMIGIIRKGPPEDAREIPDHAPRDDCPLDDSYWRRKKPDLTGLGHALKYPYSYYNLRGRLRDRDIAAHCAGLDHLIF